MALTVLLFAASDGLVPQVYYAYYRIVMPELPVQCVIKGLVEIQTLHRLLRLEMYGSLSDHQAGVTILARLILSSWTTLLLEVRRWRNTPSPMVIAAGTGVACILLNVLVAVAA